MQNIENSPKYKKDSDISIKIYYNFPHMSNGAFSLFLKRTNLFEKRKEDWE